MALLTKSEWKIKFSNFINRVSPFDVFPLIQKNEHEQLVGDDLGDSTIFREPTIQEITTPLTAFDVNFGLGDRFDVDTSANVDINFTITLQNLQGNESGVIFITKKAADTFVFSNAEVFTGADTFAQEGATSLVFLIRNIDGVFIAELKSPGLTSAFILKKPLSQSINSPSASFSIDFSQGTQVVLGIVGGGFTNFTATLSGLQANETGIIRVVKDSTDTLSFSNAQILPDDTLSAQQGVATLTFLVREILGIFTCKLIDPSIKSLINGGNSSNAFTQIKTKVVEIGIWNMVSDGLVLVPHGITSAVSKIRVTKCMIINDNENLLRPLLGGSDNVIGNVESIDATNIQLQRRRDSFFDSSNFNSTIINRGWITITYEE